MTHKTPTHTVVLPDGSAVSLSALDGGLVGLFKTVIHEFREIHSHESRPNKGPVAEILWRLGQAEHCYRMLRSLHAMQMEPYFKYLNSKSANSSPSVVLWAEDPMRNMVAAEGTLALHIYVETLYLYLCRVVQVFRDEKTLAVYKPAVDTAGDGCQFALNKLMKHSKRAEWGEHGLYSIPMDLSLGISLKPMTSEMNDGQQDQGTIHNTRKLLDALSSAASEIRRQASKPLSARPNARSASGGP